MVSQGQIVGNLTPNNIFSQVYGKTRSGQFVCHRKERKLKFSYLNDVLPTFNNLMCMQVDRMHFRITPFLVVDMRSIETTIC